MKLTVDCIIQRESEVITAEADQDLVMVSISNGFYYGVSDVAREIWESIEQSTKISHLIDHLVATYDIDRSSAEAQTLSFLDDLMAEKLLKVINEPIE